MKNVAKYKDWLLIPLHALLSWHTVLCLTFTLVLIFWLLIFQHLWLFWIASMYNYYINMHLVFFHQKQFFSIASAVAAVIAFLLLSAFHYLLVHFYHKLHPSGKISILFQDSHFLFLFYFGHLTDKESHGLSLALKNHNLDAKIIGTIS